MGPSVLTRQGLLEGRIEGNIVTFRGIPYAAPPVGQSRWRAPAPPPSWDGIREAKRFGAICPQTVGASFDVSGQDQSEDCLYLNIWTNHCDSAARQPVAVWIHGGGNLGGAGSEDAFDGARLAARGIVVVTFNYRLGAFGFLAHPEIGANFGVLDHVAALSWVQANISGFGGDPANVTIFGESAGAVGVRNLLGCAKAKGLFHRAILQSGGFERPAFAPSWSYERAWRAAEALFEKVGTRDPDALRHLPTATLKTASHELSGIFPKPGQAHTPANLIWMPVPDGEVFVEDDFPGWPADVPVLMGTVENEARYFLKPDGTYKHDLLVNMARALCGPQADAAIALLDRSSPTLYDALDRLFTTAIWFEPAWESTRKFAALGRRFYCYRFERSAPGAVRSNERARHTAEIRYVFGNLPDGGYYDAHDRAVSDLIQMAWASFARDGVPTAPDGREWPRFDLAEPRVACIGDRVEIRPYRIAALTAIIHKLRQG